MPSVAVDVPPDLPCRFVLHRAVDETGVSGTGYVAEGVEWTDGSVTIRWRGDRSSVAHWRSLADMDAVHGHNGLTTVVWLDDT